MILKRNPKAPDRDVVSPPVGAPSRNVFSDGAWMGLFRSRDGVRIRCIIRPGSGAPRTGTVVVLNGRNEFLEKYVETFQELNDRGYCVYSFDWRGQGLSDRSLPNPQKGYVRTYGEYVGDLEQFMSEIVPAAAPAPRICLGHSMGGHILLRYLRRNPACFDRIVLTSPMIDILAGPYPVRLARWLTELARRLSWDGKYALGEGDYRPGNRRRFRRNPLSSDFERYMDAHRAIRANPDLKLGGVTYGWLKATFDSIDRLHSNDYLAHLRIPVLMIGAGDDRVVSVAAQQRLCRTLPDCRFERIDGSLHEILKERDAVRKMFWRLFDNFVTGEV